MRALATILAYLTLSALLLEPAAECAVGSAGALHNRCDILSFVCVEEDAHDLSAARVAPGHVSRFSFAEDSPREVLERTVWWRSSSWLVPLLIVSAVAELLRLFLG
ncbi:MAG TPA: hypothetical protein VI653_19255 [Steroidobacteraceae bacterium]